MEAQESWSSSASSGDSPTPRSKRDSNIVILPKEERLEVLSEAAELGRLTRLNEHVVEAVAGPREEENDVIETNVTNSHHPPTNSIVATSNFQIAIQEAAEQGKLRRLKPVVIENFREREEQPDHVVSISHFKDDTRISKFLEQERQRKHIESPMERAERIQEAMDKIQSLSPKVIQKPLVKANIPLRMREDVAKKAANLSKDRFHRIQNEENELKVTLQCECPHCKNASPFQTNFYKSLQKEQLYRIKSQRAMNHRLSQQKLKVEPTLGGIAEEDEEEEDEEEVDEKLLKLRKQVEASILEDEKRRQKEEADQKKANQHANIQAAKAILEKTLFQPKAPKQDITTVESIDPDVLYSNTFGKAYTQVSRRIIKEYEMDEEEWNQKEIDEQMEQEDLRQLTELYYRQDNGEKVDEERIYELELFDRARRDAYLSDREQKDLQIYTKRRKRTDRFIEEYEDVMNRLNEGEEIDEHRAYQLEYVVKKRGLSQDLTMAEESAMIQFETEEYLKDGLNPEDFKTSYGLESSDEEDDDDENDAQSVEEENVSLHSKASRESSASGSKRQDASSIEKKPSQEDVPGAVESSDSDSSDSSHGSLSEGDDSEDSSLSYYEKDELQDLTEYKESGEEIDMDRYMDLYLFDKWKKGEKLNQKEKEHLEAYRRRRRMERNYRIEFSELVQLQATGQPHDEERFYHLQLFARRQVGQPLNHDETRELDWFVEEEERKEEERLEERRRQRKANKQAKVKDSDDESSKSASSNAAEDEKSAKSQHSNGSDEDNHIVVDSGPSIFDRVSRQSHIMDQEAKAKQKYAKSSKPKLDDISDDGMDSSSDEESSLDRSRSDGSSHESGRDPPTQRDEPEVPHIGSKDEGEDHSNSMDGSQSDGPDHEAIKRDEPEAPISEPNDQGEGPTDSVDGSRSDGSGHDASDGQALKGDDLEATRIEQEDQGEGPSNDDEKDEDDESSFLSPDEFSEYLGLIEAKDKGLDVDDDRLQLLRLINMWQFGESMSVEQEFKLDGFRRKRRKARKLKQEFADLLERSDKGEEVDEDRMYLLELFARKQIGEQLTEDEALDLKELEEKEGLTDEEGELPHPSAPEVTQGGESEQVLYSVVISDNESLPSAGEVEELEELLEREANHEEIDDKRLYALQLLMKWQNGDGLDTTQRNDLANLRYQRRKDRHYKNEFEDLLLKGDEGSPVDEDRIYFLQLYARRLLGEPLSYDEVVDLERFEGEETISFEKEEQIVPTSSSSTHGDEISGAPVAAPVLEQPPQVDENSNQLVPDPWSTDIPFDEETKEAEKINDDDASSEPPPPTPQDGSEKSGSDSIEDRTHSPRMDPPSDDSVESHSKSSDAPLESTSNPNDEEARKTLEVQSREGAAEIAPSRLPETDETPRATSRDFATLHTVPESSISPEGMPADFDALKKTDDSTNEKPLARQHDASIATTVPITEESSQNELQSTGERSAFPSSVIEVIHESMSQEGRSTLDGHVPRSDWKDKEPEIPTPIMAAMEANANLLKELDAARLETHEARERAGQEAARRAAAEDNAKYAESEAFRAKVALVTAGQQGHDYAEPMYQRNINASDGSHEKSSNVPESYLSVMAFNTKLLEQLNDTRQAALEATQQANQEAAKRAAAEENAKKAATDVMFARNALSAAAQQRELRSNQAKENSELMKPYIAAMEANAKLLEQLDAARKEALQAKNRATEEALKRSTAEENAKRAAMEAEKAAMLLLQREGEIPNDLVSDPWSIDQQFNLDLAGLPSDVPNPLSLVDIPFVANVDPEKRAQQRRERAMKAIEERRRRDAEQAVARTEAEELEKEHREQVRVAVEERKRKTRAAMEARKKQTIERAMQGMALYTMDSTGDEALQAAKRAKELLQSKRARLPAPSGYQSTENSIKPTPSSDSVDHLKPVSTADSLDYLKSRLEAGDHHDPPVQASNDPPGTQATRRKKSGAERQIQRDPSSSSGEAVRSDTFIGQVVATDPPEHNNDADKDEITHEDWYSKMEKIAMSHTTEHGQDDAPKEGSTMSPEDWYNEIEALSRDSQGEVSSNADSDMKRAIEEAQRKAAATNMESEDEVEKEVSEDVETIRRKVMKMSKDEAVNQILRQASSDVKSNPRQNSRYGRASAFDPELEASTGEDPAYTIGAASEVSSVSGGAGYELRSQQASYQKPDDINKSYRSLQSRNSRRSPRRKEKGQIPRAPVAAKKPVATRPRPTPMKNISWRSNPKDSFSDWRVEITHKETGKVDVYHLHRNILGYGARKSEYFAAQFQGDRVVSHYSDTTTPKKTKLDLPQAWAEMFPMVLDFLYYNREQTLKLTAHRSCAMYRWAEFLGIPALKSTIVDFYNKNLTLKNFGRFVASAVQMKAGPLVVASKSKIGRLVTQQPNQAWRLAPQFLVTVLEANRKELITKAKNKQVNPQAFQTASCKWSKAIYICVSRNKKDVTQKVFADLTSETCIPVIDSTVALPLLILDVELSKDKQTYSKFQKRCVQSIVKNWDSFRLKYPNQKALTNALQKLPSDVLTEILILSNNRSKSSNPQTAL